MTKTPAFIKAYPLAAKAAVHTPLVFRAGLASLGEFPWPSLEGIRDFARFAGIDDGAVRTALSRAKTEASILIETDGAGKKRYLLAPARFEIGSAQLLSNRQLEGFLLAVFSFSTEENEGRSALRGLLKDYGFRKLAQNCYIHGRIDTEGLRAAVGELGLAEHLFLFTCPAIGDEELVKRLMALFDIEQRKRELREYLTRLKAFLPENLGGDELARRLLYVGAIHWERIEAGEPPFPASYLPADYALGGIREFYDRRMAEGREALLTYYERVNR
jgi:DNA-binding transcriptional regulator PaaX